MLDKGSSGLLRNLARPRVNRMSGTTSIFRDSPVPVSGSMDGGWSNFAFLYLSLRYPPAQALLPVKDGGTLGRETRLDYSYYLLVLV